MKVACEVCGTILGQSSMVAHMKIHPQPADQQTCWIVQWVSDPLPKEQWHRDRFYPIVEVYMSWGDAFRRASELKDLGYPSAHWRELPLVGAVREHQEETCAKAATCCDPGNRCDCADRIQDANWAGPEGNSDS